MGSISRIVFTCLSLTVLSACVTTPTKAQLSCPSPGNWLDLDSGKLVQASGAIKTLGKAQVVLLGETHTRAEQHQWQTHTLAALYGQNANLAVGFEMFPRSSQEVLNQWVSGELDREAFLKKVNWDLVWSYNSALYAPLLDFVRQNRIPAHGINVERSLIRTVSEKGWEAVPADKREGLSDPATPSAGYKAHLFDVYLGHLGLRGKDADKASQEDESFQRFVQSQLTWDRAMAERLALLLKSPAITQVAGIIGSGHLANGHGVAHQLRDLGIANIAIAIPMDKESECSSIENGFADLIFITEPMVKSDSPWKPLLGVLLEKSESGVKAAKVLQESVAEQAGLKEGDIFKSIAGIEVITVQEAIKVVRRQAPGTWLPLVMERGGKKISIIAKFPLAK